VLKEHVESIPAFSKKRSGGMAMLFILSILDWILSLYMWVVIVSAILSWLIAFQVINVQNDAARNLIRLLAAVTEPVYAPIRKILPPVGGLDLSPLVVLVAIWFIRDEIIAPLMVRVILY
jgi:YggT family protein